MSVRLLYVDVAPGADEDATVAVSDQEEIGSIALLPFGAQNEKKYTTPEHNYWVLDNAHMFYDGGNVSYWSDSFTDEDGDFETPPVITITFANQYTSLGISLIFEGDAYCNSVDIEWYQGSTLLSSKHFAPNALAFFCENTVKAYNKLIITLNSTSLPLRRVHLDQILFGIHRNFERDELRHVRAEMEIDPTSRSMAANTLDWTLSSKEAVEYIFQFKQPIFAYEGDTLVGVFYISDSDRRALRLYDITCIDAVGLLDDDPFPDAYYSGINAYTLAQQICAGYEVDMDTSLKAKTVKGILKDCSRRMALRNLCIAIGAVADTSGTAAIKIFPLSVAEPSSVADRIRIGASVRTAEIVTAVQVTAHSYSTVASSGAEEVEINGVKYYDTKTVTTITNPDATANDKPKVEKVEDATLVTPDNVTAVAQLLYDIYARRNTHRLSFRLSGEQVGNYIQTVTPWGTTITGHYIKGSIIMSGISVTSAQVIGT